MTRDIHNIHIIRSLNQEQEQEQQQEQVLSWQVQLVPPPPLPQGKGSLVPVVDGMVEHVQAFSSTRLRWGPVAGRQAGKWLWVADWSVVIQPMYIRYMYKW